MRDSITLERTMTPSRSWQRGDILEIWAFSTSGFWRRPRGDARGRRPGAVGSWRRALALGLVLGLLMLMAGVATARAGTALDPAGDSLGSGPDVVRLEARHIGGQLLLSLELAQPPLLADSGSPAALVGFVDLDIDRLASTGDLPFVEFLGGLPSGLGDELYIDLSTYEAGTVDLVRSPGMAGSGEVVGRVPMVADGATITLRLDHGLLGTDNVVHTAVVVGNDAAPSDVAPDGAFLASTVPQNGEEVLLQDERFAVSVSWRDFTGAVGTGSMAVRSADSAVFWFFAEANWELMVKVVNGCAFNSHFWVFGAATTDVEYTLTVTDTLTGTTETYFNPLGTAAAAITDTGAFATCP